MLAIKFAAPHHVFLQHGYPTETMEGVPIIADKANTMYTAQWFILGYACDVSVAVSASVIR
jgi:hypothetical protein